MEWISLKDLEISKFTETKTREALMKYHPLVLEPVKDERQDVDYILLNCDDREHNDMVNEVIFHGAWYRGEQHRWAYYDAFKGELPPLEILPKVKGIVFPGAHFSVY
jgi:hypothetical protein